MELEANKTRLRHDIALQNFGKFESYCGNRNNQLLAPHFTPPKKEIFLEIGAGTGGFFIALSKQMPETFFIAIERDRMRANRLTHRVTRANCPNLAAYRGNIIPPIIHGVPSESLDRIYILYPCPWPKNSQRKHRWYVSAIMTHLIRTLKPGGLLIWASDQKFYIDEASYICQHQYKLTQLAHGPIAPNPWNNLDMLPLGRTKFEATFLKNGQPCYELIVRKS